MKLQTSAVYKRMIGDSFIRFNYVILNPFALSQLDIPLQVLIQHDNLEEVVDICNQHPEVSNFKSLKKGLGQRELNFQINGQSFRLLLMANLFLNNKIIFDSKQMFLQRFLNFEGIYIPTVYFCFDYTVVYYYLQEKEIPKSAITYFEDFHYFVKEGIVESFNEKYNTNFERISGVGDFSKENYDQIKKYVSNTFHAPFYKKMTVRWNKLKHSLKKASIFMFLH